MAAGLPEMKNILRGRTAYSSNAGRIGFIFMSRKNQKAFTIIEMLVVITVIAVLASIILPALSSAQKKSKITKIQSIIDSINLALKQYRTDFGNYPSADIPGVAGETSAECVYYYTAAAFVAGSSNSVSISAGPYMEFRQKDLIATGHTTNMDGDGDSNETLYEIKDPWGNTLIYAKPGSHNTNSFDLHSKGPDGVDGNSDDINNW